MKKIKKIFLLAIISFTFSLNVYSSEDTERFNKYLEQSTKELVSQCYEHVYINNEPNLAVEPLNIVIQRYNKNMSFDDKLRCSYAHIYNSYIYLYSFFDYSRSYDNLVRAQEIVDELGITLPYIDSHFGSYYLVLYTISKDPSLNAKALEHFKRAFNSAHNTKYEHMCNELFSNILATNFKSYNLSEIKHEWEIYKRLKHNPNDSVYAINCHSYNLLYEMTKRNYDKAMAYSDSILSYVGTSAKFQQKKFDAYLLKSKIYEKIGDYRSSVRQVLEMLKIADVSKFSEQHIEAYEQLARYYNLLGDKANYFKYRIKYYDIRDRMLSYSQVTALSKKPLVKQLTEMNTAMQEIKIQDRIQKYVIVSFILVFVIIIVSAVLIIKKNKQLNQSNKYLFDNYQNITRKQEEQRKQLKEYISKYNSLKTSTDRNAERYQGSKLEDDYVNELLDKILSVMENVKEISSPEFSMRRLVELTSSNYTYVSQVINDKCGCNFSQLLNKYRIQELCRRIADEDNYGQYTTEAIAESVGFKSRSAFAKSFKTITGLTPLQYKKIVKKTKTRPE